MKQYPTKIIVAWAEAISGNHSIRDWLTANGYEELAAFTYALNLRDDARKWLIDSGHLELMALINGAEGDEKACVWLIENKYKKTDNIYKIIQEIISEWNLIKVSCGNVKFKGNEWKEFITNGNYPKHIEVLKKKNVWR